MGTQEDLGAKRKELMGLRGVKERVSRVLKAAGLAKEGPLEKFKLGYEDIPEK